MNLHHINWHKRGEGSEALEELLCEKEYNDKDESDSIDNLGCQDLSKEPKDEVIVNAIDVDCFVLPVKVSEFLRIFSSHLAVFVVQVLPEIICVADFGYKVLINMITDDQKKSIVKCLHALGITVIPHSARCLS